MAPVNPERMSPLLAQEYLTTFNREYPRKQIPSNDNFSDVHKPTHRMRLRETRAPFWSRSMSQYNQAFVLLPLDGSTINRELAKTFQPDSSYRSLSIPMRMKTRYEEDFCSEVVSCNHSQLRSCKPVLTHASSATTLLFTESVTHEQFEDWSAVSRKRDPIKPSIEKPVGGFRFQGSTRYSEEFIPLNLTKTLPFRQNLDTTTRINGNAVPLKMRNRSDNLTFAELLDTDTTELKEGRSIPENPYILEYAIEQGLTHLI